MRRLAVLTLFAVLVLAPDGSNGKKQKLECHLRADVVLLIDSSRSIWSLDYVRQLDFLAHLVMEMNVGPDETRVGAVSFSEGARLEFGLVDFTEPKELARQITNIRFMQGGQTDTSKGLRMAREELFTAPMGDRPDVPNMIIIVTDGVSRNRSATRHQADLARQAGIKVIAVGVGDGVDMQQLSEIATRNTSAYVHTVKKFEKLNALVPTLLPEVCHVVTTTMAPETTTTPTLTTSSMLNDEPVESCTGKTADVVFVLDKSSSINADNFRRQLNFVNSVIGSFNVEEPHTHVSVVTFDFQPTVEFSLNEYYNKGAMQSAVSKIKYTAGSTNTHLALQLVARRVLTPKEGARKAKDVSRVVIVVTDGKSSDEKETAKWASVLKEKFKAYVIAIGVGNDTDKQELTNIASKPPSSYVFEVRKGYEALDSIRSLLAITACEVPSGDVFVRCQENAVPSNVMFVTHLAHSTLPEVQDTQMLVRSIAGGVMTSEGKVKVGLASSDCAQLSNVTLGHPGVNSAADFAEAVQLVNEGRLRETLRSARLAVTQNRSVKKRVMVVVVHGPISDLRECRGEIDRARFQGVKLVFIGRGRVDKGQLKSLARRRNDVVLFEDEVMGGGGGVVGVGGGSEFWQPVLAEVCEVLSPGQQIG